MTDERYAARVLVVEDEALVAMVICDDLLELKYRVVGPYFSLQDAMRAVDSEQFDLAIVDVQLDQEMSYPLLDKLLVSRVPTIVATAYSDVDIPESFKHLPLLNKPFGLAALAATLAAVKADTN